MKGQRKLSHASSSCPILVAMPAAALTVQVEACDSQAGPPAAPSPQDGYLTPPCMPPCTEPPPVPDRNLRTAARPSRTPSSRAHRWIPSPPAAKLLLPRLPRLPPLPIQQTQPCSSWATKGLAHPTAACGKPTVACALSACSPRSFRLIDSAETQWRQQRHLDVGPTHNSMSWHGHLNVGKMESDTCSEVSFQGFPAISCSS